MFDHKAMYAAFEGSWEPAPAEEDSELLDIRLLEQYAREARKERSNSGSRSRHKSRNAGAVCMNGPYKHLDSAERQVRSRFLAEIYGNLGK
ncbi:MAG: hypothetical protein LUE27_02480 [Clostridia bacterium]|nr:hypothetical protein [Clostridia bacterium]